MCISRFARLSYAINRRARKKWKNKKKIPNKSGVVAYTFHERWIDKGRRRLNSTFRAFHVSSRIRVYICVGVVSQTLGKKKKKGDVS